MEKATVLFLAANPSITTSLKLDEEMRAIKEKVRASDHPKLLELVSVWAVRPDDLLQALNEHKPHVVHFSGHGEATGEIVLVDESGESKPVSTAAVKELFRALKGNIRVVVLNACYSKVQAVAVSEVIDCAVGMNAEIEDRAARTFAASFYRALGFGGSVQRAFEEGRLAVLLEGIPGHDVPELLCRLGVDPSKVFLVQVLEEEVDDHGSRKRRSPIDEYIDYISDLPLREDGRTLRRLARARTFDVCQQLDVQGKARVLKFIYEAGLIAREAPVIDMEGIDLSGADLECASLAGADLAGASLGGANLAQANLARTDLTRANLWGADLRLANLTKATLARTDLTRADLTDADLTNADLTDAVLAGAIVEGSMETAGQVWAGNGDVVVHIDKLRDGGIYRFQVVGSSMEREDIFEGDHVIVKASHDYWPRTGDMIVTWYLPDDDSDALDVLENLDSTTDIDKSRLRATLKILHENVQDGIYYLGWRRYNEPTMADIGNPQVIATKYIEPIGRVVTVQRARRWRFTEPVPIVIGEVDDMEQWTQLVEPDCGRCGSHLLF